MMDVTLNQSQQLFVLKSGSSYSCLGFKVVYDQACELVKRLAKAGVRFDPLREREGEPLGLPSTTEIGTLSQYRLYEALMAAYTRIKDKETWFTEDTPAQVCRVIERYRKSGEAIRVFYGDVVTGRSWMDEYDVIGRVGRSMGPMKSPLLVAEGEYAGGCLLTDCIIRMIDVETGEDVYCHPKFHVPEMELRKLDGDLLQGYTHGVWVKAKDGQFANHVKFKSIGEAGRWIAFITGESRDLPQ